MLCGASFTGAMYMLSIGITVHFKRKQKSTLKELKMSGIDNGNQQLFSLFIFIFLPHKKNRIIIQ